MEEKRKLSRVLYQIRALVKKGEMQFTGEVENLSLNGLLIHLPEKTDALDLKDEVQVTIDLAGKSSGLFINMGGEITRIDGSSIAVHLHQIDLDSFLHLTNILAYTSGDYDKLMDEFIENLQEQA
jgi:hypothetical protein